MSLESYQVQHTLHRLARSELSKIDSAAAVLKLSKPKAPAIPAPSLFDFRESDNDIDDGAVASPARPSIESCAAHLELLAVFAKLKLDILSSSPIDHAMGYRSERRPTYETMRKWQDGKWTKFVDFAAVRFLAWQRIINSKPAVPEGQTRFATPPLDVLMVWHTFMLNPGLFKRHNRTKNLGRHEISWKHVHECIDNDKWTYKLPPDSDVEFTATTGLKADLFEEFRSWSSEKQCLETGQRFIGLDHFNFGDDNNEASVGSDLSEHDRRLNTYVNLFRGREAMDLGEQLSKAVLRQHIFVEKMHHRLWICSPAIEGTLRRAKDRYDKFCYLMKTYPSTSMVPTLDIDLVWHTHQCSPQSYETDMVARTGRFINHDDTIPMKALDDGFERTRTLFWTHFSREYDVCSCWDCEMMLSEVEKMLGDPDAASKMDEVATRAAQRVDLYRRVESTRRIDSFMSEARKK